MRIQSIEAIPVEIGDCNASRRAAQIVVCRRAEYAVALVKQNRDGPGLSRERDRYIVSPVAVQVADIYVKRAGARRPQPV